MYLKHLTINGFKSFAKKSELEFSSSITAIVGPNGSGKSNVAESFRFVLGEQAPSRMRGKKGEDLIWGGSDQVGRGNRASVAVTLDNTKRIFPVDFDEIALERVVHRDGENEYLVNGSRVKLKDVQEILAAANIGPSGHHIISQGEADRILSASPKERREMIEDALGLKTFQLKKSEAEKKLEKTKENVNKVESLRREVAPHLKFLEKQVKKLERAAEERDRLKSLYREYLKREDVYLHTWEENLSKVASPLQKKLKDIEVSLEKARKTLEAKGHEVERDKLVKSEAILREKRETRQELLRNIGTIEGQLSFLERQIISRKSAAVSSLGGSVSVAELDKVVTSIEREAEKAALSDDVNMLRRALHDAVRIIRQFIARSSSDGTSNEINDFEKEKEVLSNKRAVLEKELSTAEIAETEADALYREIQEAIEADQSESREAEREVFKLVNERRDVESELNKIDIEKHTWQRDQEDFRRELQEAVVLIGREASSYLSFIISEEEVTSEKREKQIERRRQLEKLKIRLEEFGGANEELEKEYQSVKERDDFLSRELADLSTSVVKLKDLIDELEVELENRFGSGIDKISLEFNRFFTLMFGGGSAELEKTKIEKRKRMTSEEDGEAINLESPEENKENGIEIAVKLPNKRVKGLDMLSGGERALTSIALIFAMSQVNPPLFVILDETDAALDEANSRRYGDMIEALAKKSQLILITHNRETMSRAGILYGVTMGGDGVSKLLSVKLTDALAVAK